MTQDEKKNMMLLKGYTYKNYYKHIYQAHASIRADRKFIMDGNTLKRMPDEDRHKWIEEHAVAYLADPRKYREEVLGYGPV